MSLLDGRSAEDRKAVPLYRGFMLYFPDAMCAVAELSWLASKQHGHNEMHWEKGKSSDHADCLVRHLLQADQYDTDGVLHATKVAWRAMANLQVTLDKIKQNEEEQEKEEEKGEKPLDGMSCYFCVRCQREVCIPANNPEAVSIVCYACHLKQQKLEAEVFEEINK